VFIISFVTCSLSSGVPGDFVSYKPLLLLFSLVDSLHRSLKTGLTATGDEFPTAMVEYVRANDSAVLEASEKVYLYIICSLSLLSLCDQILLCLCS